jgi:hypothetical protein
VHVGRGAGGDGVEHERPGEEAREVLLFVLDFP